MRRTTWGLMAMAIVFVLFLAAPAAAQGPYVISGTVTDAGGVPLPGVTVTLQLWSGSLYLPLILRDGDAQMGAGVVAGTGMLEVARAAYTYTISAAGGAFTFENLAEGTYTVHPQWPGMEFSPLWGRIVLPSGGTPFDFTSDQILVEGNLFMMGCDPDHNGTYTCDQFPTELPLHEVFLDSYTIDKHEVTNAQYIQCVNAGACAAPKLNSSFSRTWYYYNPDYDDYPVIYVSWYNARDYCAWKGKRLPTEAEWEMAARGTGDTRAYPWGDATPGCTLVNANWCEADTTSVGDLPAGASPCGAMDMAGNVLEWVNDWYSGSYYSNTTTSNPPGPITGTSKVARGGSFDWDYGAARVPFRIGFVAGDSGRNWSVGFRCAGEAPPAP